jgi:omega-amidase
MNNLSVIAIQPDILWKDIAANLEKYDQMLAECIFQPDLIVFPEMFQTGFYTEPEEVAETMDGSTVRWMKRTAERLHCAITGSLVVRENRRYFNRAVFIDQYENMTWYDKRHLFTIDGEESKYTAGLNRLVVPLKGWQISFQICYDIRFPVWAKNQHDYDVLINMASWPANRTNVWNTLLKARAIENQCYVIGVNRVGTDKHNIHYTGNSMAIDPKGTILQTLPDEHEGMITVELSWEELDNFRNEFPVWKDWDNFTFVG